MYQFFTWSSTSLLSPSSSKSIKNYRQSRKIALHFLKNSSKIQLHMDLTITLDWERSVCQGRPSASPKPLNPSKAAHPSRPFCKGDGMRLANVSENLHLPTFWRKLRHGHHGCWRRGRGKGMENGDED